MKIFFKKEKRALIVGYYYLLNDPPARQVSESLAKAGYRTTVFQSLPSGVFPTQTLPGIRTVEYPYSSKRGKFKSLIRWIFFRNSLRREIKAFNPDILVTFMLHSLAALPDDKAKYKHVACIYDIPNIQNKGGKLDHWIHKKGWMKLKNADLVWTSDKLKRDWSVRLANLLVNPLVCHNCPPKDYMKDPLWPRDLWLRKELVRQGARLKSNSDGCILVRAGGIGEYCGLEETLEAMTRLPENYIFLMLGRPSPVFLKKMMGCIQSLGLEGRVFIWNKASDEVWKKAMMGADIGQMIHYPPSEKVGNEVYGLNSGLSYNRTYLYMAAALPVIAFDDPRLKSLYREAGSFRPARFECLSKDIEIIWKELGESKFIRQKMGLLGRKSHLKTYYWGKQFKPILDVMKSWSV